MLQFDKCMDTKRVRMINVDDDSKLKLRKSITQVASSD